MLERDAGWYEAVASNEHGQARQRVRLALAEYPRFIVRPRESAVLQRRAARLEARVTGVPFPDIKWYKDWQPLAPSSRIKVVLLFYVSSGNQKQKKTLHSKNCSIHSCF